MAVVSFGKKQFEREIGSIDEKMMNNIALFGTPVNSVTEEDIEIEVFPNRPDLLSYHGFKRAFLKFIGKEKGIADYKANPPEKNYRVNIESSVKDIRPYVACAIVKEMNLNSEKIKEIIDIQEKIHLTLGRKRKKMAIGIYPLDKIKLPIIFTALEPDKIRFIPLESEKEMSGLEILQKHQAGKEYAHLLAGKEKFPIFIDADNNILSMPPIINSNITGKITESTKDLFVECSGFDFDSLKKSLNILAAALSDMGGKIYQMEIKMPWKLRKETTPDMASEKRKISLENANKFLGLSLTEKDMKILLEKMGHEYKKPSIVMTPAWRTDILHEVDLIEDIAIAYGYDKFAPEIPEIATIGKEDKKEIIKRKISEILCGLGIIEVSNYHLTTKKDQFEKTEDKETRAIEIKNSKTEYTLLRKDLTHYLMKNLSENVDSEYPQRIFEIGKIFSEKKGIISEEENLAIAISPGNFTELKQILEYLKKMIDMTISIKEAEEFPPWFIDGRVAEITLNNNKIGFIGEIHPKILKEWRIKMPVVLAEISLEEIFNELK